MRIEASKVDSRNETTPFAASDAAPGADVPSAEDGIDNPPTDVAERVSREATAAAAPLGDPRSSSKQEVIDGALQRLKELAQDPARVEQTLKAAFDGSYDLEAAESLRQKIAQDDRSWLPQVELLSAKALGGARGAYSKETETVYLAKPEGSKAARGEASLTLIEELGHHLETQVRAKDSRGDEGEIFRRLVMGENVHGSELESLRRQNDHGKMVVGNQVIEVEQWSRIPDWLWPDIGGGQSKSPFQSAMDKARGGLASHVRGEVQPWLDEATRIGATAGEAFQRAVQTIGDGLARMSQGIHSAYVDVSQALVDIKVEHYSAFAMFTLDVISAVQTKLGLEAQGRPLNATEIAQMQDVFGTSVDLSRVVVKEGSAGVFNISGDRAFTKGNVIYMKDHRSTGVLAHEITHVWQYQHGGNDYLAKAGWAQLLHGHSAYNWAPAIKNGWANLNPEQQGGLIQAAAAKKDADMGLSYIDKAKAHWLREVKYQQDLARFRLWPPPTDGFAKLGYSAERTRLENERVALLDRPTLVVGTENYAWYVDQALYSLRNGWGHP